MKIQTYATWKKKKQPVIYSVTDGQKWWAKQTVAPTIEHYGWKQCFFDCYYGDYKAVKLKTRVINHLKETWGEKWLDGKEFVYYEYHGSNGYMDCLYIWYKDLEDKR